MARRVVSVQLELLAQQYLREGRQVLTTTLATTQAVDDLGDKADAASRDMDQLAVHTALAKHEVDDLGDKSRVTAADLRLLQSRIDAARLSARGLALEFARTGDTAVSAQLGKERAAVARLERAQKLLTPSGPGGGGLMAAIPSIGGVPGPLIAGGAAAAAGLAPFLGGIVAAAVLGGVGTGGVIGGIALASQDTRVKSAFKDLGHTMFTELGDAASPLVGPLQDAAGMFGQAWKRELPAVQSDFRLLAQTVEPISEGLAGFVHELHPGLSAAIKASLPLAQQFGKEFERFGGALSDFLNSMASSAPGAKVALHDLFTVTNEGIRELGRDIHVLTETYDVLRKFGLVAPPEWLMQLSKGTALSWLDVMGQVNDTWANLNGQVQVGHRTFTSAAEATDKLMREQLELADAARKAEKAIEANTKAIVDYTDTVLGRLDATEHWEAALDDLTESVKANGKTLDIHTAAGRANRDALEEGVRAAKEMYDAGLLTEKGYEGQIEDLERLAIKLGLGKDAVWDLIGAMGGIPKQIITDALIKVGLIQGPGGIFQIRLPISLGGKTKPSAQQGKGGADIIVGTGGTGTLTSQQFIEGFTPRAGGGDLVPGVPYVFGERGIEVGVFGQPGVMYPSTQAYSASTQIDYEALARAISGLRVSGAVMLDGRVVGEIVDARVDTAGSYASGGVR